MIGEFKSDLEVLQNEWERDTLENLSRLSEEMDSFSFFLENDVFFNISV
jgi:hypothetical protein